MDENQEAWFIFSIVRNQYIMGQAGPVGINHEAIHRAMELYNIENKQRCFEQVLAVSTHTLQKELEKWKAKSGTTSYRHRLG